MLPLVTAGFLRHFPHCLAQAVMLCLSNCQYKGIANHLMQQRRHSRQLCPSGLTWLCTPVLLLAALLSIPAGETVSCRISQLISSPRLTPLRICQAVFASTAAIQQTDALSGARGEELSAGSSSADSPWTDAKILFPRQASTIPYVKTATAPRAETLPPSPHSAAHPAVFFALSPPAQRLS